MKIAFEDLGKKITTLKGSHAQKLIGIDGGGGAGKSTFAENLRKHLEHAFVIHIDDFYKGPWNARLDNKDYDINPFVDWERLESEVLKPIQNDDAIQYHVYNWHTHTIGDLVTVPCDAIVIIEGIYATQKNFRGLYDFTIWIQADESLRLDRALRRDGEHMRFLWEEDWLPVERNYIRALNPALRADMVVLGHSSDFSKGYFDTQTP